MVENLHPSDPPYGDHILLLQSRGGSYPSDQPMWGIASVPQYYYLQPTVAETVILR